MNTVILGTEAGHIVALDYSKPEPECIWTYKLPSSVRFITKTEDDRILIGGMCGKAVLINLNGKIEDYFDFERYSRSYGIQPVFLNCLLPLESVKPSCDQQRLHCITGDDNGVLRIYRLFNSKIYEKDIKDFFLRNTNPNDNIKMRCINLRDNTLRRLYTAFEADSNTWDFDRTRQEMLHIVHTRSYHYLIGPLLFLVPALIDLFIRQFSSPIENGERFQKYYNDLQNTVILLGNYWGTESNMSAQPLMKVLGVGLIQVMIHKELYLKIEQVVKSNQIPNMRNLFELLENVHVRSDDSTLIDLYEEIRTSLEKQTDSHYFDAVIKFIGMRSRGHGFNKLLPDPLLLKQVELLAFIIDQGQYCPIRLFYYLFENNADENIFHYLTYKVRDGKNKQVFEAAYLLGLNLRSHMDISLPLIIITEFSKYFSEIASADSDGFYSEFFYVFNQIRKIMSFTNAEDITYSERLPRYLEKTKWFPSTIEMLILLIDKISAMKEIFQGVLDPSRKDPLPRHQLIQLRAELKKMPEPWEKKNIGRLYISLIQNAINHIVEILTFYCEVALPMQTIENTVTHLKDYLDEIGKAEKPLLTIDNPVTLNLYNHFFREMFDAIVVGVEPQFAYFECMTRGDIGIEETKVVNSYDWQEQYRDTQSTDEMHMRMEEAEIQKWFNKSFTLYLPDIYTEYGLYWVSFSGVSELDNILKAKITRYEELVRILNLYIMAFNGIIEGEIKSRFSHRLIAHQTKEPILSIKRQLELLTGDRFIDTDGSKTRDYHERMLRNVTQILKRSENILNTNKRNVQIELELSQFDLLATVDDVVKNMRKVMDSNAIPGELFFSRPPDELHVKSDENKIREILEQLIYNSLKYCRDARKIVVKVGMDSNLFHLEVIDNGVGIPDHEKPFIFKQFYRGDESMKCSIDGDGLGLWVVKIYVDLLRGDIHVVSLKDEYKKVMGTRFHIKIPRTAPKN